MCAVAATPNDDDEFPLYTAADGGDDYDDSLCYSLNSDAAHLDNFSCVAAAADNDEELSVFLLSCIDLHTLKRCSMFVTKSFLISFAGFFFVGCLCFCVFMFLLEYCFPCCLSCCLTLPFYILGSGYGLDVWE